PRRWWPAPTSGFPMLAMNVYPLLSSVSPGMRTLMPRRSACTINPQKSTVDVSRQRDADAVVIVDAACLPRHSFLRDCLEPSPGILAHDTPQEPTAAQLLKVV